MLTSTVRMAFPKGCKEPQHNSCINYMDDSLTIQQQQQKQSLLFNNKAFYSQAS